MGKHSLNIADHTAAEPYSKSAHDGGVPDHRGPCQPWHYCEYCPCPHDHPDWPHQGHQHHRVADEARRRLDRGDR